MEFSNKITISHELHVGKSEGWSRSSTLFVFECHGRLGEYTIRLGYAPFLIAIAFMRVGCVLGPTSGIRAEVMSSGKIVGRSEGWSCPSTPFVFKCCGGLGEYTISLGYVPFLIVIAFKSVGSSPRSYTSTILHEEN